MTRRQFVKAIGSMSLLPALAGRSLAAGKADGEMKRRTLGRTGEQVSIIGIGGYHLGIPDEKVGIRIIRTAIDNGVTFLDNCWDYHDGESEKRMGKALRDGYRRKVFLMTKIDGRTAESAARQIDDSLARLQTDMIDLLQFHEIIRADDPEKIFAKGGGMVAAQAAKKAGKIRFIGFTGHKSPEFHLKMLETGLQNGFTPDTVQMPLNVMDAHFESFEKKVLPVLVQHNIGVLGMKPMAAGIILRSGAVTPSECLRYALNLPTSVVITGCDSIEVLEQALQAAREFAPMSGDEVAALLSKTASVAAAGAYEPYKTSHMFDGTYQHPEWLG